MGKGAGDLPGPVGAEIKKDDAILVFDAANRQAVTLDNSWLDKFVVLAGGIGGLDCLCARGRRLPLSQSYRLPSPLHAIPAIVPVHGIVAADYSCHPAMFQARHLDFELFEVGGATLRRGVTPVHEGVDACINSLTFCKGNQGI